MSHQHHSLNILVIKIFNIEGIMKIIIILLSILTITYAYNGSITGLTYFDLARENGESSFNFNRQYFNYAIQMSNAVNFKVVFDVGRTNKVTDDLGVNVEDTRLVVFLKKAQLDYNCDWGTTNLGLIGTNSYGVQEKNWGYRFIEKSAIDKNGFSSTADLGIGFSREIKDNLIFSIQLVNGESYKSPESDGYQKWSINTTYGERKLAMNDGYNLGFVYTSEATAGKSNTMSSLFGGFECNGLRVGAEIDNLTGETEKKLISINANYGFNNKLDAFTRYDILTVNGQDTKYLISGIVYNSGSGILISPNIRKSKGDNLVYKLNFHFRF
mgnify:CR=1 FL=1